MSSDGWTTLAHMRLAGADLKVDDQPRHSPKVRLTATSRQHGEQIEMELDDDAVNELWAVLNMHRYKLMVLRD